MLTPFFNIPMSDFGSQLGLKYWERVINSYDGLLPFLVHFGADWRKEDA